MYHTFYAISTQALQHIAETIPLEKGVPIFLYGPLGVGKTTLSAMLVKRLLPDITHVGSPTFSLMILYETPLGPLWHMDLYRADSPHIIARLGVCEAIDTCFSLVEWPERINHIHFPRRVEITLAFTDTSINARDITVKVINGA